MRTLFIFVLLLSFQLVYAENNVKDSINEIKAKNNCKLVIQGLCMYGDVCGKKRIEFLLDNLASKGYETIMTDHLDFDRRDAEFFLDIDRYWPGDNPSEEPSEIEVELEQKIGKDWFKLSKHSVYASGPYLFFSFFWDRKNFEKTMNLIEKLPTCTLGNG